MGFNWTDQQKLAINHRGESIIVSAAAGSGKTAVLANRVAKFIKDGGSCRRLLVVTFTRLAAREMKDRIINVLDSEACPSEHIREEKLLLHSAKISTIDSFFGEIVRSNFKDLGISPDFVIIDDVEYNYIKMKAVSAIMEEYRTSYKNGYEHIEKIFGGEINDEKLTDTIKKVYSFMQSIPYGEKWAELCKERYENADFWTDAVCEEILYTLKDYEKIYEEVLDAIPFKEKGMAIVEEEFSLLKRLIKHTEEKKWDEICKDTNYKFQTSPPCSNDNLEQVKYKYFRNEFKDFISQNIFLINKNEVSDDARYLKDAISCLFCMVKDFGDIVFKEMNKKNAFSFDTVSQLALKLMISDYDHRTGTFTATELAKNISEDFDEILIDEYQDVNDLQDIFFSAISKNNCFCVGDIKQSIYRFRYANPKNFAKKRESFKNIPLNMNFRSRSGVLLFSNFIFSQLFSEKIGDTDYDDTEKLNPGAIYPDEEEPDVEVKYLSYVDGASEESTLAQARFAAKEIKRIMASGMTVSDKNGIRPVKLGDIAILLRKFHKVLPIYERVFYEEEIPFYSKAGSSLSDSIEVNTVLAFLKIIDNPYDDAALFAVMFSRLYGFSADKLSELRTKTSIGRKGRLYDALLELGENDPDFGSFISDLKRFRLRSVGFPVHTLIWDIYTKTSYIAKVLPLPLGNIKRNRLMAFYTMARNYGDRTGGGTLGGFIDFAEKAITEGAGSEDGALPYGNFVRILTIHASKGLEFPICIIPELDKSLDGKDSMEGVCVDEDLGIASDRFSEGFEFKQTTFMKEFFKIRQKRANRSENLRLLYVAFTRAKEKLILITKGDVTSQKKLLNYAIFAEGNALFKSQIIKTNRYDALITAALCRHRRAVEIHSDYCDVLPSDFPVKVEIFRNEPTGISPLGVSEKTSTDLKISEEELDRRFAKPQNLTARKIPSKVSVSEAAEDEDSLQMYETVQTYKEPLFISGKPLMGAGKGSAVHAYMQLCTLGAGIETEAERLKEEGLLTSDQYDAVISEKRLIANFEKSPLYAKILQAEKVFREESFVTEIPANHYDSSAPESEKILIQGSLDMLCKYEDGFVIVDYKTNKIGEEELIKRYEKQLQLYKLAVEKNFGIPVKKCLIWSFRLSKEIEI